MKLTVAQMVAMRRDGETLRTISRAARIDGAETLRLLASVMGDEEARNPFWTTRRDARLIALVRAPEPMAWEEIAAELGVLKATAERRAKRLGLMKPRVRPGPTKGRKHVASAYAAEPAVRVPAMADEAEIMAGIRFDDVALRPTRRRFASLPATTLPSRVEGHW